MKKIFLSVLSTGLIVSAVSILLFSKCTTFKPIQVEGQPDECNDWYTIIAYDIKKNNKDGAFQALIYEECKKARKEKRELLKIESCKKRYFKDSVINKTDREKYNLYLECLSNR